MLPESSLEFRTATPGDAGSIRNLVRSAYAKWIPVIGREPRPMAVDYGQAVREHRIDLLLLDSRLAGLIETMLREDHLWIENVAVSPDDQGKGLGRRLLARAEHMATEAGRKEIRLLTNAAFGANIALYERTGYHVVKREPFMGGTTVYMSKTINHSRPLEPASPF